MQDRRLDVSVSLASQMRLGSLAGGNGGINVQDWSDEWTAFLVHISIPTGARDRMGRLLEVTRWCHKVANRTLSPRRITSLFSSSMNSRVNDPHLCALPMRSSLGAPGHISPRRSAFHRPIK